MWTLLLLAVPLAVAKQFSVSGYSGGAFMAAQMHFAFSKDCISSGVVSGGPYYCANGSYEGSLVCMDRPEQIPMDKINEYIKTQEEAGTIDSTSYLKNSTAFIFTGAKDPVVVLGVGKLGYELYRQFVDEENMIAEFSINAGHTWPTDGTGGDCLRMGIEDCHYDGAEKIFTLAYGKLNPKTEMIWENMKSFHQGDYVTDLASSGLSKTGFVYIPTNCQEDNIGCQVHIALHGCLMGYDGYGDYFITYTGLNDWAETNDIIVIYPQISNEEPFGKKFSGCFDYWGYTNKDYALKSGIQMKSLYNMAQNPPTGVDESSSNWQINLI